MDARQPSVQHEPPTPPPVIVRDLEAFTGKTTTRMLSDICLVVIFAQAFALVLSHSWISAWITIYSLTFAIPVFIVGSIFAAISFGRGQKKDGYYAVAVVLLHSILALLIARAAHMSNG